MELCIRWPGDSFIRTNKEDGGRGGAQTEKMKRDETGMGWGRSTRETRSTRVNYCCLGGEHPKREVLKKNHAYRSW